MRDEKRTMYICPRCDRVYLSVTRKAWDSNTPKWEAVAAVAKRSHRCPWDKRK